MPFLCFCLKVASKVVVLPALWMTRHRTPSRVLDSSLGMIMWCWCDSSNMKMETPALWYVPLNIYHSLYTEYEHVLLLTVLFLLWYSDSLWAAQTGEQWAPKENGRRSSHQESRLGTSEVIYSSLFFSSSSIVRLKHHPIRSCSKRALYKDPYSFGLLLPTKCGITHPHS